MAPPMQSTCQQAVGDAGCSRVVARRIKHHAHLLSLVGSQFNEYTRRNQLGRAERCFDLLMRTHPHCFPPHFTVSLFVPPDSECGSTELAVSLSPTVELFKPKLFKPSLKNPVVPHELVAGPPWFHGWSWGDPFCPPSYAKRAAAYLFAPVNSAGVRAGVRVHARQQNRARKAVNNNREGGDFESWGRI